MDPHVIEILLSNWAFISDLLDPSKEQKVIDSRLQRILAFVWRIGSRPEYWEFLRGLSSYASQIGSGDNPSLADLLDAFGNNPERAIRHIKETTSLSETVAKRIRSTMTRHMRFDPELEPIQEISRLAYCLEKCKDNPEYAKCLLVCLDYNT